MQGTKTHVYDYPVDTTADTAPARVVRMIGTNFSVLEIGSGPGSITKQLTAIGNCKVTALAIDPVAIELVKPFCEEVFPADLNSPTWNAILNEKKFDVVLAADVLEHVYDPLAVLKKMTSHLNDDGRIVLSLPHVCHCAITACLLLEDFDYRDWGLLDKTHIRFFGLKNMQTLIAASGLSVQRAEFVVRHPDETEFAAKWSQLPLETQRALMSNKHSFVYQVVIEAKLASSNNSSLELIELAVQHPRLQVPSNATKISIAVNSNKFKSLIGNLLPVNVKTTIKKVVSHLGFKV
jgi:2-polyprenyl-3-methyl-5-hydroxy-6-metoxy-1,4-benzoquinol methylase